MKYVACIILCLIINHGISQTNFAAVHTIDAEILENDPKNADNLSIAIAPLDFKFLFNHYRLSADIDVMYRSKNERFWINPSFGYDYYSTKGSAVMDSRPKNYNASDYNKPSYFYKCNIGFNFISNTQNDKRRVLIAGRFGNIKTYAIVDADCIKSIGIHAGYENFTRYIFSNYQFSKTVFSGSNLNTFNYSTTEVESYAKVNYISAGFHYQVVDHLKIKVNYFNKDKIKSNKSVVVYYFDVLLPLARTFADANVLVGVDTLFNPVYSKLPVSSSSPLTKFGLRLGLKTFELTRAGGYAGVEAGILPGPNNMISNIMLNFNVGFAINARAKKLSQK